ncbi:hypothetical protein ABZ734_11685 [Streptomyces sp. NPDC006660]|uniref:helix-turn-helix domain-containing protein n=1 Tax=Streptomyces sp. NPDC006660 TaxID=3156901 RepID=UPI0033CF87E8
MGVAGLARAADLTTKAATSAPTQGRVMYAGMRALPVPGDPVARLSHAATMLREHRRDGQLVPMAHIEHWLALDGGFSGGAYMRRPEVVASLREAADHSFRHPDFVRSGGWLQVLNTFAMAFSLAEDQAGARECFVGSEGRVTESPWHYIDASDPAAAYKEHRSSAGR